MDMNISIKEAKNKFSELIRRAEAGEPVVVTRGGKPVVRIVCIEENKGGLNLQALKEYKKKHGIKNFVREIPADFDDPLPEDFLITPMP